MKKENAAIRINLNSREIEIGGSEGFVNDSFPTLERYMQELRNMPQPGNTIQREITQTSGAAKGNKGFREYLDRLHSSKRSDKYMVASYYIQNTSPQQSFKTREATMLLRDEGVTLTNPAQYIKNFIKIDRMEEVDKRRYKLTQKGIDYVTGILRD